MPGDIPGYFPHAMDVLVIGFTDLDHIDAQAEILLDGSHAVYARSPKSGLICPLSQPVCENDSGCK